MKKKSSPVCNRSAEASASSSVIPVGSPGRVLFNLSPLGFALCLAIALVTGVFIGTFLPTHQQSQGTSATLSSPAPAPAQAVSQGTKQPNRLDIQTEAHMAELEKRVLENPKDREALVHLADLYFDTHRHALAIKAYENALKLREDDPNVLTDLGTMYRAEKQFEKALECFRKALKYDSSHLNARYNEGVILLMDLHRKDEAIQAWQNLLAVNPNITTPEGRPLSEVLKDLAR